MLLTPTKIYVKPMLSLMEQCEVKAVSHITGGGFYENIPRMMGRGFTAKIELGKLPKLPVFQLLQKAGDIPERDMYNTFNMGIGMCLAVAPEDADAAVRHLNSCGETAHLIGEVAKGEEGVVLC